LRARNWLSVALLFSLFSSYSLSSSLAEAPKAQTSEPWSVMVVLLYDQDCKVTCTKVKPAMQELAQKFGPKVKYVELNTNEETFSDTMKSAEGLGIRKFVHDSAEEVPIVGIFDTKKKRMKELQGFKTKDVYDAAIQKALVQKS
jgi:hypothetical protein